MVLSLAGNTSCLLVDDELNVLPTSSHVKSIEPLPVKADGTLDTDGTSSSGAELKGLADSLAETLVWCNSTMLNPIAQLAAVGKHSTLAALSRHSTALLQ